MSEVFDITDVTFVKRVTIGNNDPQRIQSEAVIEQQAQFLNKCLNEYPKGKIIGQEKCFDIVRIGEHQIVMQYVVYHVGFKRKPMWAEQE